MSLLYDALNMLLSTVCIDTAGRNMLTPLSMNHSSKFSGKDLVISVIALDRMGVAKCE